jgi:predicted tellurium resistance membrane protein TerC
MEGPEESSQHRAVASFVGVLAQIAVIDIIFSLDSVITAVGLAQQLSVMALAIIISVIVMMFAARSISDFVDRHPTVKMLALSFLILVGVALIAEGLEFHIPKGYIYFAMAFSVGVEMLNLRIRRRAAPVKLHKPVTRKRRK